MNQLLRSLAACGVAILLLSPTTARAQDVTEPALKAAFIYNFARFTEWPADAMAKDAPLLLCVVGDPAVGGALEQAVKARTLAGHSIGVSQAGPDVRSLAGCHIAYIADVTASEAAKMVAALHDAPVLTISELKGFTRMGGIAQFFFENGQLRFDIQLASAARARLQISSKLLSLARTAK
jgi:hypothetical protein